MKKKEKGILEGGNPKAPKAKTRNPTLLNSFRCFFPKELKKIDNWSCHKNKIPVLNGGQQMRMTFKEAKTLLKKRGYTGLSFDFKGTDYFYIDLDSYKVETDTKLHERLKVEACLYTFVEESINGGSHIVFRGEPLKVIGKAIDNRANNLLYMTGLSIGQKKIGKPTKAFLKIASLTKGTKEKKAFKGQRRSFVGFISDADKAQFRIWRESSGKTLKDFGNRSDFIYSLWNGAVPITGRNPELMVTLLQSEVTIPHVEGKQVIDEEWLLKDANRFLNQNPEKNEERIETIVLENVEVEEMKWLWEKWLPKKKFVLFAAEGGTGKSSILYDLCARETAMKKFPFSKERGTGGDVLYITAEDDISDTILPRFKAAGGDSAKMRVLNSDSVHIDLNTDGIEKLKRLLVQHEKTTIIVIDTIDSYCGNANTHIASIVKKLAGPLNSLAMASNVCIIGVIHFNKADIKKTSLKNMISGSAAWVNSARLAIVAFEEMAGGRRFIGPLKANNSSKDLHLEYEIIPKNGVVTIKHKKFFNENIQLKAEELLKNNSKEEKKDEIRKTFKSMFEMGEKVSSTETRRKIKNEVKGVSEEMIKEVINETHQAKNEGGEHFYFPKK